MFKYLLEKYVGSIIRHLLSVLAGVLIAYGILHGDGASFIQANYEVIMGILTYVVTQALSFTEKKAAAEKLEAVKEVAKEAIKR